MLFLAVLLLCPSVDAKTWPLEPRFDLSDPSGRPAARELEDLNATDALGLFDGRGLRARARAVGLGGRAFGSGRGGRGGSWKRDTKCWRSASAVGGLGAFALVIVASTRRRRGSWTNGNETDGCHVADEFVRTMAHAGGGMASRLLSSAGDEGGSSHGSASLGTPSLGALCDRTIGAVADCLACGDCGNQTCMSAIPNCSLFLTTVYPECLSYGSGASDGIPWWVFGIIAVPVAYVLVAVLKAPHEAASAAAWAVAVPGGQGAPGRAREALWREGGGPRGGQPVRVEAAE